MSRSQGAFRGARLLLRARTHPLAPRYPVFTISARFTHKETNKQRIEVGGPLLPFPKTIEEAEKLEGPLSEEQINDPDAIPISVYEQDHTSPTGERLIQHIRTPEERRKHNEIHKMLMEEERNPDYDDRQLNRHMLDELMKDPYFSDLTDELQDIKTNMMWSKEEQKKMLKEAEEEEEPLTSGIEASLQMATHESLQKLMEDPDFQYAREELEELQTVLPESGSENNPEYEAALNKVLDKLGEDPTIEQKITAWEAEHGEMTEESVDKDSLFEQPEELDKLLVQMKDLMGSMGGDDAIEKLETELEQLINEDPSAGDYEGAQEEEIRGREMSFTELSKEILQLAKSSPAGGVRDFDEDGEPVDPELEAKVDKIMQDPKLMEKLMYIQKIITEENVKKANIEIPHELAPDPLKLEPNRVTSIRQRLQVVRNDPGHLAALQALRVNLLPPFNIAPALRLFNEAIEYAYIGQNDDIRRILWRAYSKARALPTFLQNLSDDAWDIIYYSQAVTWGSNQNRENHLRLLLQDLRSVGKDGPPTHPSALTDN